MSTETYAHDGTDWRKAKELYVHDGTEIKKIKEAYAHDGTSWRKVFGNAFKMVKTYLNMFAYYQIKFNGEPGFYYTDYANSGVYKYNGSSISYIGSGYIWSRPAKNAFIVRTPSNNGIALITPGSYYPLGTDLDTSVNIITLDMGLVPCSDFITYLASYVNLGINPNPEIIYYNSYPYNFSVEYGLYSINTYIFKVSYKYIDAQYATIYYAIYVYNGNWSGPFQESSDRNKLGLSLLGDGTPLIYTRVVANVYTYQIYTGVFTAYTGATVADSKKYCWPYCWYSNNTLVFTGVTPIVLGTFDSIASADKANPDAFGSNPINNYIYTYENSNNTVKRWHKGIFVDSFVLTITTPEVLSTFETGTIHWLLNGDVVLLGSSANLYYTKATNTCNLFSVDGNSAYSFSTPDQQLLITADRYPYDNATLTPSY